MRPFLNKARGALQILVSTGIGFHIESTMTAANSGLLATNTTIYEACCEPDFSGRLREEKFVLGI